MTFTPRVSAAAGASPEDRTRKPKRVRHSTHADSGTISKAMTLAHETLNTRPRSTPAMSGSRKNRFFSSQPSMSGLFHPPIWPPERNGMLMRGMAPFCWGDLLMPPPVSGVYTSSLR